VAIRSLVAELASVLVVDGVMSLVPVVSAVLLEVGWLMGQAPSLELLIT
jgi:hypothetical protein